ncbi:MAG: hypothetical protein GDA41_01360 [Rhodospirillales bacterium]|nr:hypothetical protein [Rhodospirillales bacterium]
MPEAAAPGLRPPEQVMQLERMGASFQTRLSFVRQLIRRMSREGWRFERRRFDVDAEGFGSSVYSAHAPQRTYSLVAFTHAIAPEQRSDRVIAEAWDATFSLFDGIPDEGDIERLRANTPKQEAGRFRASELVLARANKSVRLFEQAVASLAAGRQPDRALLGKVGYLMRTTAVYGSGKFGCADREKIAGRPEMRAPFQAELLAVYLIRWLTVELVDHVARCRGGARAVGLHPANARYLGIGNATGLGMAPFLVKYPILIGNWVAARETALARVRALPSAGVAQIAAFLAMLARARRWAGEWQVEDQRQSARIERLRADLAELQIWCSAERFRRDAPRDTQWDAPWDAIYRHAEASYGLEGQEFVAALLLEPHGDMVDELGAGMGAEIEPKLKPAMPLGQLRRIAEAHYRWTAAFDFSDPQAQRYFWYYSQDKLEPRLGTRKEEPGAALEMPLAIAREVKQLLASLRQCDPAQTVAEFLAGRPEFRYAVRRVQTAAEHPYAEIRANLLGAELRPIDILRFKLAFFGVSKFDPKSDLWTRVNIYQGAPLPHELADGTLLDWAFPVRPRIGASDGQLEGA